MRKVRRVLHFLRGVVRPSGFAPFDDEGRATGWYALSVVYFLAQIAAQIHYIHRLATTKLVEFLQLYYSYK